MLIAVWCVWVWVWVWDGMLERAFLGEGRGRCIGRFFRALIVIPHFFLRAFFGWAFHLALMSLLCDVGRGAQLADGDDGWGIVEAFILLSLYYKTIELF